MNKVFFPSMTIVLTILFLFISCSKDGNKSGIEIQWVEPGSGEVVSVFTYANGVASGQAFFQKFNVLNESGEISIVIKEPTLNLTKTSTFTVEKNKQYKLTATINYTVQSGILTATKCQTFVFSSPTCSTTKEVNIYQVRVQVGGPVPFNFTVCPGSVAIGDVSISIVK
jgi:hypothetical protein